MMVALWWLCGLLVLVSLAQADRGDVQYKIWIVTGSKRNAGTDSVVFLSLYGSLRNMTNIRMENSANHYNKFESGQTDEFHVALLDLGTVTNMNLRMTSMGQKPGWYVRKVSITDPDTPNKKSTGNFDRWYGPDESGM